MKEEMWHFFPFSQHASERIKEMGFSLDDLIYDAAFERVRIRGKERVISGIKKGEVKTPQHVQHVDDMELLSYPFVRILVSCIGDERLARRYARAEARAAYKKLLNLTSSTSSAGGESVDAIIHAIAEDIGLNVMPFHLKQRHIRLNNRHFNQLNQLNNLSHHLSSQSISLSQSARMMRGEVRIYQMHFTDYLRLTSELKEKKWRLVNRELRGGFVLINGNELLQLFQEAFYKKVKERLPLDVPEAICNAVRKYTEEIKKVWSEWLEKREGATVGVIGDFVGVGDAKGIKIKPATECFPPCISYLLKSLLEGEELTHSARFALTAFLLNIGMRTEDIIHLYENAPDFNAEMTRYQIEHIAGSKGTSYKAPSCKTMRTYGICIPNDELCEKISHPLIYYAMKVRKMQGKMRNSGENKKHREANISVSGTDTITQRWQKRE